MRVMIHELANSRVNLTVLVSRRLRTAATGAPLRPAGYAERWTDLTRRYFLRYAILATLVTWRTMGICADQGLRSFKFRNGITISVPNSWVVVNEQDLRQYELARDTILKEKGVKPINPGIKANVPFQATRRVADTHSTGSVMFTLRPPEATEVEVAAWASP